MTRNERLSPTPALTARAYRAGCGQQWTLPSREPDLAYTGLELAACPVCPHRVEPGGAAAFCTLRPVSVAHPFAGLRALLERAAPGSGN